MYRTCDTGFLSEKYFDRYSLVQVASLLQQFQSIFKVFVCLIYYWSNLCICQSVERMSYTSMLDVCLKVSEGVRITDKKS